MKNTFKKMAASIMAVASLAVSAFGINANAVVDTDGTGKVETYSGTIIGTSALSVTSTYVWVQTATDDGRIEYSLTAAIPEHSGSINENSLTRYGRSETSFNTPATGVTYASSYHEIEEYDGTVGTGTLTVYR